MSVDNCVESIITGLKQERKYQNSGYVRLSALSFSCPKSVVMCFQPLGSEERILFVRHGLGVTRLAAICADWGRWLARGSG